MKKNVHKLEIVLVETDWVTKPRRVYNGTKDRESGDSLSSKEEEVRVYRTRNFRASFKQRIRWVKRKDPDYNQTLNRSLLELGVEMRYFPEEKNSP